MKLPSHARFSTVCIHAGQEPDPSTGAIITPIFQTSTYVQEELGKHKGFEYGRTQNPTRATLEANLAAIEGGKAAFAYASGMSATERDRRASVIGRSRRGDRQHVRRHVPSVRQSPDALWAAVQLTWTRRISRQSSGR
jgi:cystathionine beta-lyase/cystathionine gamma-synthase